MYNYHLPPTCFALGQVTLKERKMHGAGQDLETVFALSPVIQEGENVLFESYARIKHLATRTWLHLDRSKYVEGCGGLSSNVCHCKQ